MTLYELTMTSRATQHFSSQVFEAPSEELAIVHGRRWPAANGWSGEIDVTVARFYPLKVGVEGIPIGGSMSSIFHESTVTGVPL